MVFLTWERQRMLVVITIALSGLANIDKLGISNMIAPLVQYPIVGDIKIKDVIGVVTVILAWMLYNRRIG